MRPIWARHSRVRRVCLNPGAEMLPVRIGAFYVARVFSASSDIGVTACVGSSCAPLRVVLGNSFPGIKRKY